MTKGKKFISGQTIPSVAARLGISEPTLRRAIDKGEVATVRFNGLRRIRADEERRIAGLLGTRIVREWPSDKPSNDPPVWSW